MSTSDPPADPAQEALNLSSWIGQGKKYKDVPDFISQELCYRLLIPENEIMALPSKTLPISQLLDNNFSLQTQSLYLTMPESCFSKKEPNTTLDSLLQCPIPSRQFASQLCSLSGQALLDGKQSYLDLAPNFYHKVFVKLTQEKSSLVAAVKSLTAVKRKKKGCDDDKGIWSRVSHQICMKMVGESERNFFLTALGGCLTVGLTIELCPELPLAADEPWLGSTSGVEVVAFLLLVTTIRVAVFSAFLRADIQMVFFSKAKGHYATSPGTLRMRRPLWGFKGLSHKGNVMASEIWWEVTSLGDFQYTP
ncbi:hypothetical protein CPB84DRAFT_1752627 [Gymnopilus junonius]|uniref:Uncharacterized protein n=1 Tax=Gymnopilus junonius TaxID=109634 RepID=A0A9P5TH53_GYMJU|nr:hypothetical protein CPB84DRAFT_1752627 [Gymnopilus junonius]